MSEYIARDAVEKAISVLIPSMSTPDGTGHRDELILSAQEMCVDIIKAVRNVPSVDVAPVVHGKWIEITPNVEINGSGTYYACSECGKPSHYFLWKDKYCPNCGCRMIGDGENDEI